jgi:hypothetical protein
MPVYKELSEYISEDGKRRSTVLKNTETKQFVVRATSDSGSVYTATYDSEEDAEQFAEDWVMK